MTGAQDSLSTRAKAKTVLSDRGSSLCQWSVFDFFDTHPFYHLQNRINISYFVNIQYDNIREITWNTSDALKILL